MLFQKQSTGLFLRKGTFVFNMLLVGENSRAIPKRTLIDFPNKSVINLHPHCISYAVTFVNNDFFNQQVD